MSLTDRLDGSTRRIDNLLNVMGRREIERQAAQDAERMMAEREQARADSEKKRVIQTRYDDAFSAFGTRAPQPVEGERPGQYRRRMFELLRTKLPTSNEWSGVRADDVPASARQQIEALVIKAAMAEGLKPSVENLPRDGSLIRRERTDQDTGARSIEWAGRRSFIADMGRESQLVARSPIPAEASCIGASRFITCGDADERFVITECRLIFVSRTPCRGTPKIVSRGKPAPYPRNAPTHWQPRTTKAQRVANYLDTLARREAERARG